MVSGVLGAQYAVHYRSVPLRRRDPTAPMDRRREGAGIAGLEKGYVVSVGVGLPTRAGGG